MSEPHSLVNVGELSKPATVLIERVSDAVGGIFKPYQMKRVAKAEAEVAIIRAKSEITIEDIHRRAFERFLHEEAKKQDNMEQITAKALPHLNQNSKPNEMSDDWLTNFFDKSRLISDDQMQQLWAKVLAGEANAQGKFSRRTIDVLASLDRRDAELFSRFCTFVWAFGSLTPLIFNVADEFYESRGLTFNSLMHLESLGLIQYNVITGFQRIRLPKSFAISYFGQRLALTLPKDSDNELDIGHAILTSVGGELALVCNAQSDPAFYEFVKKRLSALVADDKAASEAAMAG